MWGGSRSAVARGLLTARAIAAGSDGTSDLRRQVDHVEGYLRDGLDAMDAFLAHTWAVTVNNHPDSPCKTAPQRSRL